MKIKFGSFVVAGSGKVGGHVAATNRGGAYLRTKVTPLNPRTAAQSSTRGLLASLSRSWSALTDAQRKSWNDAVSSYATTDIFGDLRNPSGINLYVKLNANLYVIGVTLLTDCPPKGEVPFSPVSEATCFLGLGTFEVIFDSSELNGTTCKVSATPPMSQGVSFVKSQLRVIGYLTPATSMIDIYDDYVAKFGIPSIGSNVVLSISPITDLGQQGTPQSVKASIVA